MFRHPKYYKELRKRALDERNKSDQVISGASATASVQRAPGPGQSLTRDSNADGGEGSSSKRQATGVKPRIISVKRQATGGKLRDPCTFVHGPRKSFRA